MENLGWETKKDGAMENGNLCFRQCSVKLMFKLRFLLFETEIRETIKHVTEIHELLDFNDSIAKRKNFRKKILFFFLSFCDEAAKVDRKGIQ